MPDIKISLTQDELLDIRVALRACQERAQGLARVRRELAEEDPESELAQMAGHWEQIDARLEAVLRKLPRVNAAAQGKRPRP